MSELRGPILPACREGGARRRRPADRGSERSLPADAGRIHRPPHPLLGILFVFMVAEGVLWGAGAQNAVSRVAIAYLGLCVFLAAAVHLIDSVEIRHVLPKLGMSRARRRDMALAAAAALPAWIACAVAFAGPSATAALPAAAEPHGLGIALDWTQRVLVIGAAALWLEGFYRGFVFRSLMRRHRFVLSASLATALACLATLFEARVGAAPHDARWWAAAVLELPLSLALCQLFWLSGPSLWPALLVRVSVLLGVWFAGAVWPL
ncbi:MAG: hypothetical protein ACE5G2_11975, partial [Candidatus Krumholzibacteriia bacterium]